MVMIAVCLAATIITEFFSNAATAAMIVPVMYSAAQQLGYDPYPFVIALMLTVCTGFLMPFSSSLYMMVYSAGGYRFSDFMRIGLPVKVVAFITYIVAVSIVYPFTPI
jgi:di/tricarboxylate transporter